jgi:hypothetical protein
MLVNPSSVRLGHVVASLRSEPISTLGHFLTADSDGFDGVLREVLVTVNMGSTGEIWQVDGSRCRLVRANLKSQTVWGRQRRESKLAREDKKTLTSFSRGKHVIISKHQCGGHSGRRFHRRDLPRLLNECLVHSDLLATRLLDETRSMWIPHFATM